MSNAFKSGLRSSAVSLIFFGVLAVAWWISAPPARAGICPNEALRAGASAHLPDCRAYELVSPSDANGRMLEAVGTLGFKEPFDLFPTELASPSAGSIVYMTFSSPLASPGKVTGAFDVYQTKRLEAGWQTVRRLTPSGDQSPNVRPGGVSSDHGYSFVNPIGFGIGPPAGSLGQEGISDYLSRPDGTFEFTATGQLGSEPYGQGRFISEGGQHVIFTTGRSPSGQSIWCSESSSDCRVVKLEEKSPPEGTGAVYDRSADGSTHVVSLLPGDVPQEAGEEAYYKGNSKDARSIAFTIDGSLYVRVHNGDPLLEETEKTAEGNPVYAGLSEEGRYLFYIAGGEKGTIHRFDTESKSDVEVNPAVPGELVNISSDGSHVYFIAEEQIGGQGEAAKPNLFVWNGGTPEYVATVAASDLERTSGSATGIPALTRWTSYAVAANDNILRGPGADSSRSTSDGTVLVFESRAKLTEYNNTGHAEIYRWDDAHKQMVCVSCNFGKAPQADARLQDLQLVRSPIVIHNLSADGSRVFFETEEGLVEGDTDGINDIYEWHQTESSSSRGLISSGRSVDYPPPPQEEGLPSPLPNRLLAATPSGSDVVFLSKDALVPRAGVGGAPAIYDAREGGGFAEPSVPASCLEEGCHPSGSPAVAPALAEPQSKVRARSGNVKPRSHRCHRAKGRHKKPRRCVRRKPKRGRAGKARASSVTGTAAQTVPSSSAPSSSSTTTATPNDLTNRSTAAATGEFGEFGIESVAATASTTTAGMHPDFTTSLRLNHYFNDGGHPEAKAHAEDVVVSLPPGLLGNPNAVPPCSTGEFTTFLGTCPANSQVGLAKVLVQNLHELTEPVYNMEVVHPNREIARLGFYAYQLPVFINVKVRTAGDFGVTATVEDAPGLESLLQAETILWGNPADSSHDKQRFTAAEALLCPTSANPTPTPCKAPNGERPSTIPLDNRKAFMTNPSACQGGFVDFAVTSYQLPGQVFDASAPLASTTDCSGLPFAPIFSVDPTNPVAGAPAGLRTKLVLPQHLAPEERATATMREARVTLPAGMQIAAGAANWIGTCSDQQVGYHEEVDAGCPDSSKLGTATIVSPALPRALEGNIYQRTPSPGHQFGLWLVSDDLGLHVKLPGELQPDPATGRLTAVFTNLPQVPVEEIDFNIWGGDRAPLQNPDHCGTYTTDYSFSPHSKDPSVSGSSQLTIDQGCNQGFDPKLDAGVTNPRAGKFSPLIVDLAKGDGQQNLRGFELELPDGELAKLKGVPLCPDAAAATGACPADSAIGHLAAAAGPGSEPLWVPQAGKPEPRVYLSGPYQGSPFSIVTVVPAQAGPFDLGNVVVRSGLGLDPDTNRAVVKADPLPQFFEGVGLTYRRLHVLIDRPGFSLNPTDCRSMQVDSTVSSTQGAVAHPTSGFQVGGCKRLKFAPRLSLKLQGGTKRGQYPALTAMVKARKGDANIARTSVALPHSEFLAQEHIGTICTRKQFSADKCPKGSVYGKAKAWTPLLAKPLEGPVYLRSSDHPLPDLVVALGGELEVNLDARIDSDKAGGIRTSFEAVPDAPITKFVLRMKGGAKSLLVNSTDLCRRRHRAQIDMRAQNGRARRLNSSLLAVKCATKGS
jgi:hypothetical protein